MILLMTITGKKVCAPALTQSDHKIRNFWLLALRICSLSGAPEESSASPSLNRQPVPCLGRPRSTS